MAKTYKQLYSHIAGFEALYQAWRKARRGKRYKPAAAFERNLDVELTTLFQELQDQTWQPGSGVREARRHCPSRG